MPDPVVLSKANPFKNDAENYDLLRLEGIKHIEKLSGNIWTDYNVHDPGITLLEVLCYAITDLAYRTGFEIKDLISPEKLDKDSWKNIFYTARRILPSNPLTINDYRKLLIDIVGVRNAWIAKSEDCEVPIYISYPKNFDDIKNGLIAEKKNPCNDENKIPVPLAFEPDKDVATSDKIIELNGLYKIIIEYDEDVIEKQRKQEIRKDVMKKLHSHRNLCEDFLSVTSAEYRDFSLKGEIQLKDNADPEMVLAQICFQIQNYFTPGQKFYTLEELIEKGKYVEDIFEGPFLDHGFIDDEELEKTDLYRDMRLSDIINNVVDIDGIIALRQFRVNDDLIPGSTDPEVPADPDDDPCSNEKFFDEWIAGMQKEKLVGRLNVDDIIEHINDKEPGSGEPDKTVKLFKSDGPIRINTARFKKLLDDLKALDRNSKLIGQNVDLPVPSGENINSQEFYPVQYTLPKTYRVDEEGLPRLDDKKRRAQALQLKGYMAIFEQLLLNYVAQLNNINQLFSFNEIDTTSFIKKIVDQDGFDPDHKPVFKEEIIGYLELYADSKKYVDSIQELTEEKSRFYHRRNNMLDHLLARFSEEMNEYAALMKYLYPNDHLKRIIKNKTDLLSDYVGISKNRGRAYNYKLEDECWDITDSNKDEEKISCNVSGVERRVSRLLGLKDFRRKYITPENLYFDKISAEKGVITLYDDNDKKTPLLKTEEIRVDCEDDIMHCFIESGCCDKNFIAIPEQNHQHVRRKKHYSGKYSFILRDENDPNKRVLAESLQYATPKERDEAMKKAKYALKIICREEAIHMVEHILLRPKGDNEEEAVTMKKGKPPEEKKIPYNLLDICLDKCDLEIGANAKELPVMYRFEITVLTKEECIDNKRWKVELKQVGKAIAVVSDTFKEYSQVSEFISRIREYGSEFANFKVFKTGTESVKYFFRLYDENKILIFESQITYSSFSSFSVFKKKDIKEAEKEDEIPTTDTLDAWKELKGLKEFFAYERDLYCCEDICDHNEDPYSFRVSFVLPCWPKRFRDKNFRAFVERTIRAETPAHIDAKIYWLGIEQMRRFEDTWFEWLVEMACNNVPEIGIVNAFITEVKGLRNCDQPCKDEAHD